MQGYVILAQALASQNVKHCYGIVGNSWIIQEFQSSNLDSQSKLTESTTMDSETNSRPATLLDILDIWLACLEFVFASQDLDIPTQSVVLLTHGPTIGPWSLSVGQTISTKPHARLSNKSIRFTSSSLIPNTVFVLPTPEIFPTMFKKLLKLPFQDALDQFSWIFPETSWQQQSILL